MNTTTKPGALQVMDAEIASLPIMAEMMTGHYGDAFDAEEAVRRMTEARATVERLAEDAEALLADLELDIATSPSSSYRMVSSGKRIAALRAALAAFRGDV